MKKMEQKNGWLIKAMPWLLIVLGFLRLNLFQGFVALPCMVIGVVMLIERKWPEKWDIENDSYHC